MTNENFRNMHSSNIAVAEVPVFSAAQTRKPSMSEGAKIDWPLSGGRSCKMVLMRIPANQVEQRTLVWGQNERDQVLLTDTALSDLLPSMQGKDGENGGQRIPAVGRVVNGLVEVADGSRRRRSVILTNNDFWCWVGDLSDEDMTDLSEVGNYHKSTSEWERARKIEIRLKTEFEGNQSQASQVMGISRRSINRALMIASVPREVVAVFGCPNQMTGRKAQRIAEALAKASAKRKALLLEECVSGLYVPPAMDEEQKAELITQRIESILSGEKPQNDKVETEPKPTAARYKISSNPAKGKLSASNLPASVVERVKVYLDLAMAEHFENGWYEHLSDDDKAKYQNQITAIEQSKVQQESAGVELDKETWFDVQSKALDAVIACELDSKAANKTLCGLVEDMLKQENGSEV
ncbi:ParB/RepB/Spo0J family partition protein [Vibrio cholerae]|nr:ParB/RepB/Spo0J family partition protein [Vibrio cholerae]